MLAELDDYDWKCAFGEECISIKPRSCVPNAKVRLDGINREAVAKILAMEEGENEGQNWIGVFRLKDGRYITVNSGCDYTGWDCQASGDIMVAATLEDAVRYGLDDEERERLGVQLKSQGAVLSLSKWKLKPIEEKR